MKQILIDGSSCLKELTGIGVYTNHLLRNFLEIESDFRFCIFFNALKGKNPDLDGANISETPIVRRHLPGKLLLEIWAKFNWPKIENLARLPDIDLFHSPNFLYQPSRIARVVATVHDLAFLKNSTYGSRYAGAYHRKLLASNIARATRIIAISEASKLDIIDLLHVEESRIDVIHLGISQFFLEASDSEQTEDRLASLGIRFPYIFSMGTVEPRKNFPWLIEVFSKLSSRYNDIHLIIAGRFAEDYPKIRAQISRLGLTGKVKLMGYVDDSVLRDLYRGAKMCIFPAWEEGFGLGLLEAAACKCPVIASRIAAHQELLGSNCRWFDPQQEEQLSAEIVQIIDGQGEIKRQVESAYEHVQTFSWRKTAIKHLETYRKALSS